MVNGNRGIKRLAGFVPFSGRCLTPRFSLCATSANPQRPRPGFTLLEVLLVLALMVVFGSIAWPALRWSFGAQKLRAAAEQIRVDWMRARLAAIKTQTPYIFRYVPGESVYTIEPVSVATWTSGSVRSSWDTVPGMSQEERSAAGWASSTSYSGYGERSLPEGIIFVSGTGTLDIRGQTVLEEWAALSGNYVAGWTETVIFFPDGTATDAEVVLQSDLGREVNVWIRGLTGVVQVGPVVRTENVATR